MFPYCGLKKGQEGIATPLNPSQPSPMLIICNRTPFQLYYISIPLLKASQMPLWTRTTGATFACGLYHSKRKHYGTRVPLRKGWGGTRWCLQPPFRIFIQFFIQEHPPGIAFFRSNRGGKRENCSSERLAAEIVGSFNAVNGEKRFVSWSFLCLLFQICTCPPSPPLLFGDALSPILYKRWERNEKKSDGRIWDCEWIWHVGLTHVSDYRWIKCLLCARVVQKSLMVFFLSEKENLARTCPLKSISYMREY